MSDVSFILVYVDDVARSKAFYAAILGRGPIESSSTFAMLPAAPNLMLGLWQATASSRRRPRRGGEIAFAAATTPSSTLFAEWQARGVAIALRPT